MELTEIPDLDLNRHRELAINRYKLVRSKYEVLSVAVKQILIHSFDQKGILYHKIENRAKEIESFGDKAAKPNEADPTKPKYEDPLNQIEDLAGVRVITFLPRTIEDVCKCIESEFDCLDKDDKSARLMADDKFGYQSIHYIVKLSPDHIKDYKDNEFENLKIEIQVRTILQHAWAEIEHDIQYKSEETIPPLIHRRFMDLAGMLEIADREFQALHDADKGSRGEVETKQEIILEEEITETNLGAFLLKAFPDREHSEPKYVAEIVNELLKENCRFLKDVENLVKAYPLEKYVIPLDVESGIVSTDVGVIRSLLVAKKIDEINEFIESWRPLPLEPKQFIDSKPFVEIGGRITSYLMKYDDKIRIEATNVGALDITNDELGNRIGTGLPYLRRLKERLEPFHEEMLAKARSMHIEK